MTNNLFEQLAKRLVYYYAKAHLDSTDDIEFDTCNVFIVWSCKTLQNNKALLSTDLPDGMYYEITYNGDKEEFYFDAYKKFENRKFDLAELIQEDSWG